MLHEERVVSSGPGRFPQRSDLQQVARGMLMGAADVVPGVSGGTVALILGIYERLVSALGKVDRTLIDHLNARRWRAAAEHLDLRFLATLLCGIGLGIALFARGIDYLLHHQVQLTFAAFFGLIAASSLLVGRMVGRWRGIEAICLVVGIVFAIWLVNQPLLQNPPDSLTYVFFCGVIAICAMILPGISGSFILLILGKYVEIVHLVKEALQLNVTVESLLILSVFSTGCVIGLLSFSKFLKWLLGRHESQTLAVLCGFMLGSLWKLWPFQQIVPGTEGSKTLLTETLPWSEVPVDGRFWLTWGVMLAAAAFVLLLDWLTSAHEVHPHMEEVA
jgi:putative membrane protein